MKQKHLETAYVVKLHNIHTLDKPKAFATFVHPNKEGTIDNSRHKKLEYSCSESATLHGFAGYFDTVLYKDVTLSLYFITCVS